MRKLILPGLAFVTSMSLLGILVFGHSHPHHEVVDRSGVTTVNSPQVEEHSIPDAGVDAGPENVRPTAEQLAKEYLTWELRDIEAQATTPEDKQLVHRALEIRLQRAKDLAPSNDFEKNMQRAVK